MPGFLQELRGQSDWRSGPDAQRGRSAAENLALWWGRSEEHPSGRWLYRREKPGSGQGHPRSEQRRQAVGQIAGLSGHHQRRQSGRYGTLAKLLRSGSQPVGESARH
ncbi:hypothetical protein D3C80_1556180 [compost metagenome]